MQQYFFYVSHTGCKTAQPGIDRDYAPKNLKECVIQLDYLWNDSLKQMARGMEEDSFMVATYEKTGNWIRWKWLNDYSEPLYQFFQAFGVERTSDMATIVLTSYHRHLNGRPIELQALVNNYSWY